MKDKITIKDIYDLIGEFRKEMQEAYVTKAEFLPVKAIVYGLVALLLSGIFMAFLGGIIKAFF